MNENSNDGFSVDDLLRGILNPLPLPNKESLRELFDRRVAALKIPPTSVLDILKIEYRTLNGILDGKQKRVDFTHLIKIANFLQLPTENIIKLYIEILERNFPNDVIASPEKAEFIKDNFDLAALRKSGFINSITDYDEIEKTIVSFFGLKSIFDYEKPPIDVAFSEGMVKPKNELTRSFWIKAACKAFEEINNPYEYSRQSLVEYFPQIRWHSTNIELGLKNVIRDLFKIGITVIYQPPLASLHLRGATFAVNDKPCIVLTNLAGFYPTLWFALIHELFHVIFDWDEIKNNCYHLSDEDNEQLSVIEKEQEADNFAREYLFSKEKTTNVRPYLNDTKYINEYAITNHVHPSFIYVFNAYDFGKIDRMAWSRAKRYNPDIKDLIKDFENTWERPKPISEHIKEIKFKFYN